MVQMVKQQPKVKNKKIYVLSNQKQLMLKQTTERKCWEIKIYFINIRCICVCVCGVGGWGGGGGGGVGVRG